MVQKARSEKQILPALRQAESGTTVREICREYGDSMFYIWKSMPVLV